MKIDQLPAEALTKIFSFLPEYGDVGLVNKRFYDIACKVHDSKVCLQIDRQFCARFLHDDTWTRKIYLQMQECFTESPLRNNGSARWLQSILSSNRGISQIEIGNAGEFLIRNERRIIPIVAHFSATVTVLKFTNVIMDESAIRKILSAAPNVEHLHLVKVSTKHSPSKRPWRPWHRNDDFNLKNLKSLTIVLCSDRIYECFFRRPVGIPNKLEISLPHLNWLNSLVDRRFNIAELKLSSAEMNSHYRVNDGSVAEILSKQTELKTLIFGDRIVVDGQLIAFIVELSELEILSMDVPDTLDAFSIIIPKLKKLKKLTLNNDELRLEAVFDTSSIKTLNLNGRPTISDDTFATLAKYAKQLKNLRVSVTHTMKAIHLHRILSHFNSLVFFEIESPVFINSRVMNFLGGSYKNLKKMVILKWDNPTRVYY